MLCLIARLIYPLASLIWSSLIICMLASSWSFWTLQHLGFRRQILRALIWTYCFLLMIPWGCFIQQELEYKKCGWTQVLYTKRRLSSLMFRLLSLHSWNNMLFAFFTKLLQWSFHLRWGVSVIPRNFSYSVFPMGTPFIFRLSSDPFFDGFLKIMYWVLLGFILISKWSHQSMRLFNDDCRLFWINCVDRYL